MTYTILLSMVKRFGFFSTKDMKWELLPIRCFDFPKILTMRWINRVLIQNSLHQNKNREEVKNKEIRHLPDLSIVSLLSVFVWVQRFLNSYPIYPTHCLYFGEVETPYWIATHFHVRIFKITHFENSAHPPPGLRLVNPASFWIETPASLVSVWIRFAKIS